MTQRTASTLTRLRDPTAISFTSESPERPYAPSRILPELILEPSRALTSGTTDSSRGLTPLSRLSSLRRRPLPRVSSETTRTSAPSILSEGPYMSSMTKTSWGLG